MNKWIAKGFHAVEDVKAAFKKVLVDRKGGSTVEYVLVLAGAAALATLIYNVLKGEGGGKLKDKLLQVINNIKVN